jgi:hypothetical protein
MARNALIQVRRDTAATWTSTNPTLAAGEMGLETDTGKLKVGTGSTAWTSLLYATDASDITGTTLASNVTGSSLTGVGTLTVLTVTGDLTVDTTTLKVDSTNNRVGIGTSSPSQTLDVNGGTKSNFYEEKATVSATAATGTIAVNAKTTGITYYTTNASANFVLNLRGDASTTLSSLTAVGDTLTISFLNTNGTTAYYPTSIQVDGTVTGVTTKWQGGTAPSSGNASSIDSYVFMVVKTAATPTYTVFASQTKFA